MSRSSEGQLVALARGLFGQAGNELQQLLLESWPVPAKVSPEGLKVLCDTLGKGAVLWLTRQGAWRDRLWARQTPPPIAFEASTVQVLQWLLEQPLGHDGATPLRLAPPKALGCELVLLAALATSVETPAERQLVTQPAVRESLLCRVSFPSALVMNGGEVKAGAIAPTPEQDFALEALQPALARWWRAAELLKARLLLPTDVLRVGLAQARVLDQLFTWAEQNDRRERCEFLLEAMAPLLHERATVADFVSTFDDKLPLRERQAARRAAGAVLQALARLHHWDEQARTVRFIDDGYEAAQARVRRYEARFGVARFALAQRLSEQLEALPA